MLIKYRIRLAPLEREQLLNFLRQKHAAALRQAHARILLKADESGPEGGLLDADIAVAVEVSVAAVERVRRRFVEDGLPTSNAAIPPRRSVPSALRTSAPVPPRNAPVQACAS